MFSFAAGKVEWPFFDLKVFWRGADVPTDSRDVGSEKGVD
jgi:hypothetical protein